MSQQSLFDDVITELENELNSTLARQFGREKSFLELFCTRGRKSLGFGAPGVLAQSVAPSLYNGEDRFTDLHPGRLFAIQALVPGLRKRYIGPTNNTVGSLTQADREAAAESEFLEDNARCEAYNKAYDPSKWNGFIQEVRGEVIDLLNDVLESPSDNYLDASWMGKQLDVGPGSSSDRQGDSSSYSKLGDSEMSFSSRAVQRTYKMLARMSYVGLAREAVRDSIHGRHDSVDSCAVFVSVPKTNLINRGICTQPSGNMVLQQRTHCALADILRKRFDCDLANQQSLNGDLAYRGSRGRRSLQDHSWEFTTWDLSRASNFPWVLIQDHFPTRWMRWLRHIRSSRMRMPSGVEVTKHMCSTMGNGYTFALMTLFLSAIVVTLYKKADLPLFDTDPITGLPVKTWAVYGDDIIVDKGVANGLQQVLAAYGFLVNRKKSFDSGFFRESCGKDYYDGYPVRPVFCESLETQSDVYSLLNRLVLWGVQHSVALPRTCALLRSAADTLGEPLRVPNTEDVAHGLHVPFDKHITIDKAVMPSYMKNLVGQCGHDGVVFKSLAPKTNTIRINTVRVVKRHVTYLSSEFFLLGPVKGTRWWTWDAPQQCEVDVDWRSENLFAFLLGTISGSIRNGTYSVRSDGPTLYSLRWMYAPSWGLHSAYGGTASCARTGTAKHVYALWEEYVRKNVVPPPKKGFNWMKRL